MVYSNNYLFSRRILIYSQKWNFHRCSVSWFSLSYFGAQARGAKVTWGLVFMVEVKSSLRVEEKHLVSLKIYIWNSCCASSGQSICHRMKPQISEVCKYVCKTAFSGARTVMTTRWTIMQTFSLLHLLKYSQMVAHFLLLALIVGLSSYLLWLYPHSAFQGYNCHHALFVSLPSLPA